MASVEVCHAQVLRVSLQDKSVIVGYTVEDVPNDDGEHVEEQQVEQTEPDAWVLYYYEVPVVQAFECKSFIVIYNVPDA